MSRRIQILVAGVFIVLSLLGLYHLLSLQFETGEAYPHYSSLRADPLGTMALFEALGAVGGVHVERNTENLSRVDLSADSTLLIAGAGLGRDAESMLERLEEFVDGGGRLTILFRPYEDPDFYDVYDSDDESEEDSEDPQEENDENEGEEEDETIDDMEEIIAPLVDISERWGFGYGKEEIQRDERGRSSELAFRQPAVGNELPESLTWQSDLYFEEPDEEWTVTYTVREKAVVMKRAWGDGSIVLATDNYHLTNEAMLAARAPEYLIWLIGDSSTVVFDETHLGISPKVGLMGLMIHYQLVPVMLVCLFLSALFVWKNTTSFVQTAEKEREEGKQIATFGTVEGLARLTKRSVSRDEVLDTCWALFQNAPGLSARLDKETKKEIEGHLARYNESKRRKRDVATTYNAVCSLVNERKKIQ
jgi:hypothetical protein